MNIEQQKRFYTLVILIPILVGLLWLIVGAFSILLGFDTAYAFTIKWNEDFESLDVGNIDGQGYFETQGQTNWQVSTESPLNGAKGLKILWESASYKNAYPLFVPADLLESGEIQWKLWIKPFRDPGGSSNSIFHIRDNTGGYGTITFGFMLKRKTAGKFSVANTTGTDISTKRIDQNNWAKITLTADLTARTYKIDVYTNGEDWTTYQAGMSAGLNIYQLTMECYNCGVYVDDMEWEIPPALVWGDDPASGTEITALEDILTIGYEGLDLYDSLYITLKHPATGIFTGAKRYDIIDIGGSGELEIPLTHLDIDKNGNWYLHAVATYEGYQYEDEYFLSGYGWNWTEDLTDGTYYLDINIDGFPEIFGMSDFETWYGINAKFDTPTDMFLAIAGFFEPIFSVIGEFGNRITDYFNVNESYGQGYEIGRTIAYFSYFIDEVSLFLGGFPILLWLFILILLLVGFFIFRLVLKFIPFLGGS